VQLYFAITTYIIIPVSNVRDSSDRRKIRTLKRGSNIDEVIPQMSHVRSNKSNSSLDTATNSEHSEASTTRHKPAKRSRNRVPAPQRERILQKHVTGKSIVEISREENRNRETVARIVHSDEMRELVSRMREKFFGLAESALSTVEEAVEEKKDAQLAYKILLDTGIVPTLADRMRILAPSEPINEQAAVYRIMAQFVGQGIAKRRAYGYDPTEYEQRLADAGGRVDENGKIVPIE
jgi:hypothetical protein